MTRALLLLIATAISARAQAEFLKPEGIAPATGYTHAVVVSPGKLVFIAGQIGANAKGEVVGKGDLKAQAEQALENMKFALAAAGTSFDHVVKLNWYVKDFKPESLGIIREVRNRYINTAAPPASTLVGVAALFMPDYLVEVEAVASIPKIKKKAKK